MRDGGLQFRSRVAPYLVTRLAGVPFVAMDDLASSHTHDLLDLILRTEAWLRNAASRLCETLYLAAGTVESTSDLRRHLINAKRNLFNLRIPRQVDLIQSCLSRDEAALLTEWIQKAKFLHQVRLTGEKILQVELDQITARLQRWSQYPEFAKAVVLASLPLHQKLETYVQTPVAQQSGRLRKLEASLVMYLTRAATKTSPFSTLTPVAMGTWSDGAPPAARWEHKCRTEAPASLVAINQAQVMRLSAAVAAHPDFRDFVKLRLNPTLERNAVRYTAYGCFDQMDMGRVAFTGERLVAVPCSREVDWLIDVIRDGADRWSAVERLATGVDLEYLRAVLKVLVDAQIVEAHWPISENEVDYVRALLEALDGVPGERAAGLRAALGDLEQVLVGFPKLPARDRVVAIESLSSRFADACRLVDINPASLGPMLLFEDAAWPGTELKADPRHWQSAIKGLSLLQRTLPLFDRWRHGALVMRDFFIQQHGVGGICDDVVTFVLAVHEYIPYLQGKTNVRKPETAEQNRVRTLVEAFADRLRAIVGEAGLGREAVLESAWLEKLCDEIPEPLLSFSDAHAYFVQPLPANGQFVLNEIAAGLGRSVARFAHLLDAVGMGSFSQELSRYLGQVPTPGQRMMELPGTFGFNANRRPAFGDTTLDYPGVILAADGRERVRVHDLCIRHCTRANRLMLVHRKTGTELLPLNLGALTFLLTPVLFRGLSLFDPVGNVHLPLIEMLEADLSEEQRSEVRRYPRIRLEGTYLMRETWVVPRSRLPGRRKGDSDFEFACQIERWRREMGLPRRVFVRATLDPDGVWARAILGIGGGNGVEFRDLHRKPQYIDFESPLLVDVLERHLNAVDNVLVVQEMLPGSEDLLVTPAGDRAVSEWIVELHTTS